MKKKLEGGGKKPWVTFAASLFYQYTGKNNAITICILTKPQEDTRLPIAPGRSYASLATENLSMSPYKCLLAIFTELSGCNPDYDSQT